MATPISETEAAALLDRPLSGTPVVALAVSGGPDSLALLHLAERWARRRGVRLLALTVDHGLRPEAAGEAAGVAAICHARGLEHRTIVWDGRKPTTGLQAAAREARLSLLTAACHAAGTDTLLLAHHREDQAETILHRVDRGTGPEGLAGMAPESWRQGVRLVRPLLGVSKTRLSATCLAAGLVFVDDPSNRDPRFARVRLRRLRPALDAVGLTVERLIRLSGAMGIARERMRGEVRVWLAAHGAVHRCGTVSLGRGALAAAAPIFSSALLRETLAITGGAGYPPAGDALSALVAWCVSASSGGRRTLGGCLVEIADDTVIVMRELAACAPPDTVRSGATVCWDRRFLIRNGTPRPVRIGACGPEGWRRIKRLDPALSIAGGDGTPPHAARLAWPIVTDLDGVVTLPHLVPGEQTAPYRRLFGVSVELLATRERRIDGLMANGRLTT